MLILVFGCAVASEPFIPAQGVIEAVPKELSTSVFQVLSSYLVKEWVGEST